MLWVSLWKLWMNKTAKQKQGFASRSFCHVKAPYEISRVQTCAAGHKIPAFHQVEILNADNENKGLRDADQHPREDTTIFAVWHETPRRPGFIREKSALTDCGRRTGMFSAQCGFAYSQGK